MGSRVNSPMGIQKKKNTVGWSSLGTLEKEIVQVSTILEAWVEFGLGREQELHGEEEAPRKGCPEVQARQGWRE